MCMYAYKSVLVCIDKFDMFGVCVRVCAPDVSERVLLHTEWTIAIWHYLVYLLLYREKGRGRERERDKEKEERE